MNHYWTLLAKKSHIDQETNSLVLGEIIEEIQVGFSTQFKEKFALEIEEKKAVTLPYEFEIISYLGPSKPNETVKILIEVELPNHHKVNIIEQTLRFEGDKKMRNRIKSNAIQVGGTGTHIFRVLDITSGTKKTLMELPLSITVTFK